ncbi:hypothetical protein [Roseimicrobium sp. ORNL1]|uniref:hypothetical protein n=1 Tax=Roseimicrobium sp. ORNL1 TaxID=2711231 RepID=UPI0013E16C1D|nr:hypothetical protein [Roseimicrobium sp. ORNL1]QIF05175.1 hypothetical protein G5S37_27900 [Roseimicrobium sp. ORNL1]
MFKPSSLMVALVLGGSVVCDKSSEAHPNGNSVAEPNAPKQESVESSQAQHSNQIKSNEQPLPPIAELSPKVKGGRKGTPDQGAVLAMYQLLKQWSPVGKQVDEVKAMLGEPSEVNNARLLYRFDDGDQAYEWTFTIGNGVVTSLTHELIE